MIIAWRKRTICPNPPQFEDAADIRSFKPRIPFSLHQADRVGDGFAMADAIGHE
jgi:hypothetical protein